MDAIYLLIPLTLVLLAVAIGIFFWAVNSDQYSDLDKEASRILFEEKGLEEKVEESGDENSSSDQSTEKGDKHIEDKS
ncbi:MAG: cbb3-type cytochrome oxidase assembly protein CcoS [Kangiella sp.]|jgi:cbb3-type cytochrome oxidase maturation protein|nr:cbb3-type cytochrome oxidase assembly protein CcoS [Kangiella sp.]MCW9029729.1 cbb3-type cytochrome oxidase assembly protein CcoS [Kangiella sp.]